MATAGGLLGRATRKRDVTRPSGRRFLGVRWATWLLLGIGLLGSLINPAAWLLSGAALAATALPSGFGQDLVVAGLMVPTAFAFLPDGRILVAEQRGTVRVYKQGALLPTPFLDLRDRVNAVGDCGLLGMAVDPDLASTGYLYLLYTHEL